LSLLETPGARRCIGETYGVRDDGEVIARLRDTGVQRGSLVGLAVSDSVGFGLAVGDRTWSIAASPSIIARIDQELHPRWVVWSQESAVLLVTAGVRVGTCWDIAAVHRLLFGGWRVDPARSWAALQNLSAESIPTVGQFDFLTTQVDDGDDENPVRPDGHLRPEWVAGVWSRSPERLARWAATALAACGLQRERLAALSVGGNPLATARSESAAELLCAELAFDGLPVDVAAAEGAISSFVGPRPSSDREAAELRRVRDHAVVVHAPDGDTTDLRNPAQVKALLMRIGIDVPDTRAWRLEEMRTAHPLVDALLTWRKAERVLTTYGYSWLDQNVGADGRLRGAWSGSDGAAGRMTAQAGLHNMPADMRVAVIAELGHVFVRADLGQIEPRVLAAVSGDAALATATTADDLYAPVAQRLGVERAVAKVAVLAAMYGQTSGTAGQALRGLESAYPVAMRYLHDAAAKGEAGTDIRTFGGRLVRMGETPYGLSDRDERAMAASRGRYARNAMVQGAAAELFKVWAVTVRARGASIGARIVLCLHDELLLHVPTRRADEVVVLLDNCLREASHRWTNGGPVRFVTDTSIIHRWSDAKS
jgi:DNA polymerase I